MTFSRRLATGTFTVLIVALAILFWRAQYALHQNLEAELVTTLEREARLVRDALPDDRARWQATVRQLSLETELRITLIDAQGTVLADSDFPEGPLPPIENHAGRPEVRDALAGTTGHVKRYSQTVGRDLMYVALRGGPGVVRVAEDLGRVNAVTHRMQRSVAGAALLALLAGLVLAVIGARSVSRPLTGLASAARSIAAGTEPRYPRSGVREIDALVRALRDMHHQIDQRFEDLRREKAESSTVVEAMAEGVIAADARGRVTTANSAARHLLGYTDDATLPGLAELFRARGASALVQAALTGEPEQMLATEFDGRTVQVTARALPGGGAVLVLHDLTTLRRLEAVRRDFVANVSHELKTPLTSISGYSETLLTDQPDQETARRFLEIILANARRMQHLVDDLLDLSRAESGRWQPAPAALDPGTVTREAWAALGARATGRAVDLRVEVPEGLVLFADPDAARQVLTNLLDNALRYTPEGGRIVVRAEPGNGGVALQVSDTGSGIAREHLPRIFERFYRADPSRARSEGGTGLGLSIVRHLVESHGGRVTAESELGQGTTITCWFPAPGTTLPG
jgi:two-component system phosphate regulon sensor histidine kinase PhoR